MITANSTAFLESWSAQFLSQANTVRNLIGDAHWLSDGHHRESILRDFIGGYLPVNVTVSSGFVKPPNPRYKCSNEIDILISDVQNRTHYYNQNGLRIIPPEALVALIEVKSKHSKKKLGEALVNICAAQLIASEFASLSPVWSGIAFFDTDTKTKPRIIAKQIETLIHELIIPQVTEFDNQVPSMKKVLSVLPTCIFNLSNYIFLFSESEATSPNSICMKYFEVNSLAPAIAIYDMFSSITSRYGTNSEDDILQMIGEQNIVEPSTHVIHLGFEE